MQALILAAGRGSRLGDQAGGTPKALLEIGRRPLIDHQIEALAGCGVGPVAIVVGYGADEVREAAGIKAEYLRNPRWNVTNSLYSFWLARDWVREDVVVLNCDVLFSPEILERLLDQPGDCLAYDSSSGERREEMSVEVIDGLLRDMSKTMPPDRVSGENVGMLKLTQETARAIFQRAGELIEQGRERDWLGSAVKDVAATRPIRAVDIHGLPWAEIDFPADLDRARRLVLPAIERAKSRRKRRAWSVARWAAAGIFLALLAFSSYRAWIAPDQAEWEILPAAGPQPVVITNGSVHRPWLRLTEGEAASAPTEGPTTLRINVRPLLAQGAALSHVVLKITIDGRAAELHSLPGRASSTWTLDGRPVGKQERVELDVPAGSHVVGVTLSADEGDGCLVRFAELSPDA